MWSSSPPLFFYPSREAQQSNHASSTVPRISRVRRLTSHSLFFPHASPFFCPFGAYRLLTSSNKMSGRFLPFSRTRRPRRCPFTLLSIRFKSDGTSILRSGLVKEHELIHCLCTPSWLANGSFSCCQVFFFNVARPWFIFFLPSVLTIHSLFFFFFFPSN